jgi:ABC-type branched-subunit amino acid transport system ATPase component
VTLLRTVDLTVTYGAVRAVDALSIDVGAGELVGLIGPNGAGKTTCIDAICGFTPCSGSVVLDGRPLDGIRPDRRARLGAVRSFQQVELFDDLDVRGNLLVAADGGDVSAAVDAFDIASLLDRRTTELSEGERKLVGLARVMARGPRVLLLDEPAAGLDTAESRDLGVRLRRVADSGIGVLLVDHDMELVLGTCDRVHVIDRGRLLASGPPDVVRDHPDVVAAYLGTAA